MTAVQEPQQAADSGRSRLSDFAILQELGRGTWGTVLLARRVKDGQLYALKRTAFQNRSQKDQQEAVREAQLLASLDSPHIVRYFDSFLDPGTASLYICMEFCGGGSLHRAIREARRPLHEDTIWRVLLHTALALHHMHSRRIIHRDVKSLNVFVTGPLDDHSQPPKFKLGDVGISKVLEVGHTYAETFLGTPLYLSPEVCQGKPYDFKSDVWALGVVLYSCATKRHPFDAQSQPGLLMKILKGRFDPVIGLSPELTAIIHRCLSQAAARRPSAELLLSLPAVRAKAAELGIELPALALPPVAPQPGGSKAAVERLSSRRVTCPDGGPDGEVRPGVRRQTSPHVAAPPPRKPPLPAAAVPTRRTDQHGARAQPAGSPAAAPAAAPATPAREAAVPAPPRPPSKISHFSVQQHLSSRAAAGSDDMAVQRSSKSDTSLLHLRPRGQLQPAAVAEDDGCGSPCAGDAAEEADSPSQRAGREALRQRAVALLGSEALFEELRGLVASAADGEGRGGATLAALSEAIFKRLGYTPGAAEALHILLRMLSSEP